MEPAPAARSRRRIGWLVKGPLGCLCFLAGATAVTVVLMPFACGRGLARSFERQFSREHAGTLELGKVHMPSFLDRQSVRGLVVRDPAGREVARGSIELPSLPELVSQSDRAVLPACELYLSNVDLVLHEDGTTNLARAFAPRTAGRRSALGLVSERGRLRIELGGGHSVTLGRSELLVAEAAIGRLSWSRQASAGPPLVVRDLRGRPTFEAEGGRVGLSALLEGKLSVPPESPAPAGSAVFLITVPDLQPFLAGEPTAESRCAWRLSGAEAAVVDGLLGCGDLLARTSGAEPVDARVELWHRPAGERVTVVVESPAGRLELGAVRGADGLRAAQDDALRLAFPAVSAWAAQLFGERGLVPWIAALRPDDPARGIQVVARDFELVPGAEPPLRAGALHVDPGAAELELAPSLRRLLPGLPEGPLRLAGGAGLRLELGAGAVRCAEASLVLESAELRVAGTCFPASGAIDLRFTWSGGAEGTLREVRLGGTLADPQVASGTPRD